MRKTIAQSANYKWWAFGTVAVGTMLSLIDEMSVLIALPNIESHFDVDLTTVQWVVVGYSLAISVFLLPMGRLADVIGRKQVYVAGFATLVVGAALAGLSANLPMLVGARVLEGVGLAMLQGNGIAIITSVFPGSERGKVLGFHLAAVGIGAIVGPALGGFLVSSFGWRSVFLLNISVGI